VAGGRARGGRGTNSIARRSPPCQAASVRGQSNQVLSAVLRAGRESTAGRSPLSTPDSILMCYQKSSRGRDEQRRGLCYDTHHVWAVTVTVTIPDKLLCVLRGGFIRKNFRINPLQRGLEGNFAFYRHLSRKKVRLNRCSVARAADGGRSGVPTSDGGAGRRAGRALRPSLSRGWGSAGRPGGGARWPTRRSLPPPNNALVAPR